MVASAAARLQARAKPTLSPERTSSTVGKVDSTRSAVPSVEALSNTTTLEPSSGTWSIRLSRQPTMWSRFW